MQKQVHFVGSGKTLFVAYSGISGSRGACTAVHGIRTGLAGTRSWRFASAPAATPFVRRRSPISTVTSSTASEKLMPLSSPSKTSSSDFLDGLEARAKRMQMPYLSDPEWARLNSFFPIGHDCRFNVVPGEGDLWHMPASELAVAVANARTEVARTVTRRLLK